MRSGATAMGAIETAMIDAAYAQVGKSLGLPTHAYLSATDAKVVDAQAGIEATVTVMTAFLARCNLVHDVGYIEYGTTSSMEMVVITDEIIRDVRYLMGGVEVSERTLAREAIHRGKGRWRTRVSCTGARSPARDVRGRPAGTGARP
jgi:trimethylamine--corrinoid protein Co-methyltransferase